MMCHTRNLEVHFNMKNINIFSEFSKKGFVKIKLDKKYVNTYKDLKNLIKKKFPKSFKDNSFENY